MNRNNILLSGTILSLGYLIYKYIKQSSNYKSQNEEYKLKIADLLSQLEIMTNIRQEFERKCNQLQQNVKEIDVVEEKEKEEDYSYLSSYMKLEHYLKDLNIIPNKILFELISKDNIYIYLEDKKWYIKNDDNTFSVCSISIEGEIINSQKLTKKIDKLKTISANPHILSLWKNTFD